jgi:hypothetical protein
MWVSLRMAAKSIVSIVLGRNFMRFTRHFITRFVNFGYGSPWLDVGMGEGIEFRNS